MTISCFIVSQRSQSRIKVRIESTFSDKMQIETVKQSGSKIWKRRIDQNRTRGKIDFKRLLRSIGRAENFRSIDFSQEFPRQTNRVDVFSAVRPVERASSSENEIQRFFHRRTDFSDWQVWKRKVLIQSSKKKRRPNSRIFCRKFSGEPTDWWRNSTVRFSWFSYFNWIFDQRRNWMKEIFYVRFVFSLYESEGIEKKYRKSVRLHYTHNRMSSKLRVEGNGVCVMNKYPKIETERKTPLCDLTRLSRIVSFHILQTGEIWTSKDFIGTKEKIFWKISRNEKENFFSRRKNRRTDRQIQPRWRRRRFIFDFHFSLIRIRHNFVEKFAVFLAFRFVRFCSIRQTRKLPFLSDFRRR